jgi:hypothetical protein
VSTADQLLSARLFAIASRHCARHQIDDLDSAVAELQQAAGGRVDLLSELAGLSLGFEQADLDILAPQHRAVAELCFAAGADRELAEPWITKGMGRLGPPDAVQRRPATAVTKVSISSARSMPSRTSSCGDRT